MNEKIKQLMQKNMSSKIDRTQLELLKQKIIIRGFFSFILLLLLSSTIFVKQDFFNLPVIASTIQHNCDFGSNPPLRTNWSRDCQIPSFDEKVNGKLQSVIFKLTGQISASMKVKNGDVNSRSGTTTTTGNITVALPDGQNFSAKPEITYTDTFAPCEGVCGDTANSIPPSFDQTPNKSQKEYPLSKSIKIESLSVTNNLEKYTKNSSININAQAQAQANTNIGGNYALSGVANGLAYLEVTYNYLSLPRSSDSVVSNTAVNLPVDLSKSLNGTSKDDKISYFIIKTLPNLSVCKLFLKSSNGDIIINSGQTLDYNQLSNLICTPSDNSAGKSTDFSYLSVDSKGGESNQAVVKVTLMSLEQPNTLPPPTFKASLMTKDCSLKVFLEKDKNLFLEKCFEYENSPSEFRVSNFRNSNSSLAPCGSFYLNNSIVTNNQVVSASDIKKIAFVPTVNNCNVCNVGFDVVGITDGQESNKSSVNINPESCVPEVEETLGSVGLARSGGYFENNREVIVLLTVLFFSIAFFFSSLSTENIKKVFSRK
jgi:hypothetical protein